MSDGREEPTERDNAALIQHEQLLVSPLSREDFHEEISGEKTGSHSGLASAFLHNSLLLNCSAVRDDVSFTPPAVSAEFTCRPSNSPTDNTSIKYKTPTSADSTNVSELSQPVQGSLYHEQNANGFETSTLAALGQQRRGDCVQWLPVEPVLCAHAIRQYAGVPTTHNSVELDDMPSSLSTIFQPSAHQQLQRRTSTPSTACIVLALIVGSLACVLLIVSGITAIAFAILALRRRKEGQEEKAQRCLCLSFTFSALSVFIAAPFIIIVVLGNLH